MFSTNLLTQIPVSDTTHKFKALHNSTILLVLLTNSKGDADGTFETNVVVLWNW